MLFIILVIVIVSAVFYGLSSHRRLSLNERLYLRRRGYEPPADINEGPPVSKDARLFSVIESLTDISPYARQRAAEDLSRMCASGERDSRMLSALIARLMTATPWCAARWRWPWVSSGTPLQLSLSPKECKSRSPFTCEPHLNKLWRN